VYTPDYKQQRQFGTWTTKQYFFVTTVSSYREAEVQFAYQLAVGLKIFLHVEVRIELWR